MKEEITYDDFAKLDIRIAEVLAAEVVEESDKLLKLRISLGGDPSAGSGEASGERQILAGLKNSHDAASLVGKKIVVLANLAPRKMMGLESQGMLLAAGTLEDGPVLLVPDGETKPGSVIS